MTSEDGYILGLQRIPTGRSGEKADKPPVLLQHGLFVVNNIPLLHIFILYLYACMYGVQIYVVPRGLVFVCEKF